jgi:short-subunit dehydrogenase
VDHAWAVVTGASSGIGRELARGLGARGHPLVLVARRREVLHCLAKELNRAHGVRVEIRECNLADRAERAALRAELSSLRVSVLCANAGFPTCGPVAENDPVREADEVEVNVVAVHELTLAVLPGMLERRAGAILITGSTAGAQPVPTAATYAATKAFANTFAEALHVELRGSGVTCTLLAPGPVRTEFSRVGGVAGIEDLRWFAWQTPERVAAHALRGLDRGRRVVIPGPIAKIQAATGRHTPRTLVFPLLEAVVLPRLRSARATTRRRHGERAL